MTHHDEQDMLEQAQIDVTSINDGLHAEATKPPPRYTEATLLSAMETAGKLVDDEELADAMKLQSAQAGATFSPDFSRARA